MNTPVQAGSQVVGIYTRTIVRSPVVKLILHARIRATATEDVVFVGEDSIQVKQVADGGHLIDIAAKHDFDACIRTGAILATGLDEPKDEIFIKDEFPQNVSPIGIPPHVLVLTLENGQLSFIWLTAASDGSLHFVQQNCALAPFRRPVLCLGEHLATDPHARGLAVGASEREIMLYSIKSREQLWDAMCSDGQNSSLVSAEMPFHIIGVIQKMDFLFPPSGDQEHIILLLLVADQGRVKAVWIDWHTSLGPAHAQLHPGQVMWLDYSIPSLLIPLPDAAFFIASNDQVTYWQDLVTGSASGHILEFERTAPSHPGESPSAPTWTCWSRPYRRGQQSHGKDFVYLLKEDGQIYACSVGSPSLFETHYVGNIKLHNGTAFTSFGLGSSVDVVVVGGETSVGKVAYIGGSVPSQNFLGPSDDPIDLEITETISNWATVTDMITADQRKSSRGLGRDVESLLVTSGRQPFGSITEIRRGIEARLVAYTDLEDLRTITSVWAILDVSGAVIAMLSGPSATKFLLVHASGELEEANDEAVFDAEHRTLAAGLLPDGRIIQCTTDTICTNGIPSEDSSTPPGRFTFHTGAIVCAALAPQTSTLVTAERGEGGFNIFARDLSLTDLGIASPRHVTTLTHEPLCIEVLPTLHGLRAWISTADGMIVSIIFDPEGSIVETHTIRVPGPEDHTDICDHITVLQQADGIAEQPSILLVCGLRDGRLLAFRQAVGSGDELIHEHSIQLGHSTVKVARLASDPTTACAMSGSNMWHLSWDQAAQPSLLIESIWLADRSRPDFAQGAVIACAQVPSSATFEQHIYADCLLMISGEDFLIATYGQTPGPVPRQMAVSGTPSRVIYAQSLRCLVAVSHATAARDSVTSRSSLPRQAVRQVWPVVDFIPNKSTRPSFSFDLQPGERIHTVVEWPLRTGQEKTYSHILLGGSYVRRSGNRRGRVTFLKPTVHGWRVDGVSKPHQATFDDPVYALAWYDPVTYIACAGEKVHLKRFVVETKTWEMVCPPFQLASPGVFVSVASSEKNGPLIVVSTARDSLVMLRLEMGSAEPATTQSPSLIAVGLAPQAETLLSHLVLPSEISAQEGGQESCTTISSTKYGKIFGLTCPLETPAQNGRILFEAYLPRSLTRMMPFAPPTRKASSAPPGVSPVRMVGCSADGALTGLTLINAKLWRQLFWLQRLCEWSPVLCPNIHATPPYEPNTGIGAIRRERALPVGLCNTDATAILHTVTTKPGDMHVDGDIITRILRPGGAAAVKDVLNRLVVGDNSVGAYLREHLEEEIAAVDEALDFLRLLEEWM